MPQVNYLAVLVATVASFVVGAIWYSPLLFTRAWLAENGAMLEKHKISPPSMGRLLTISFVTAGIAAYAMAVLLVPLQHHSLEIGLRRGFAAGVCWLATALGSSYAFEARTFRHWAINAGYYVAQFTVMGMVLGVMNG